MVTIENIIELESARKKYNLESYEKFERIPGLILKLLFEKQYLNLNFISNSSIGCEEAEKISEAVSKLLNLTNLSLNLG